ncbi:MAG: gamma-glutamyltransferase family protein [Halodesulfurarchaeum sp.]
MAEPDLDRFDSRRSTLYAPNGAVATSQPLAAQAGVSILREGGNAFDAAVATAAALNVVEPTSTGLGGDVFALFRTADGEVGGMQSCGAAPEDATAEAIREAVAGDRDGDPSTVSMPETGPHTVTVPGTAAGWEATIERLGTLSLSRVLEPAVSYATEGYPVTEVVSAQWEHGEELFEDENARAAYLRDGRAPAAGETMSLPDLGRSLELVGERGAGVVYEGEIGEAIVDAVQDRGGLLSRADLADHEVHWVEPVSVTYRGVEVFELPPPNQGLIALEALSIFEALDIADPFGSPAWTHGLIEATKTAFHDGHHYITDPAHEDIPPLADPDYTSGRAAEIGDRARADVDVGLPGARGEEADTVLLTVGDREGNLVSFINSRFAGFGSGIVAGETGIALQNRGSAFSLDPEDPNVIAPGKRPFHTLIPGLARFGSSDWAAFGVMGGYMQPQGHVQVLTNVIDGEMPLQAALDRPRWRYLADGSLAVEERMGGGVPTKLARRGHEVRVLPPNRFGGAQIVREREEDGVRSGATEPRKDGVAIGY